MKAAADAIPLQVLVVAVAVVMTVLAFGAMIYLIVSPSKDLKP